MVQKPSIPIGTRDFSPSDMARRNFIFDTIKRVFQKYGYVPIQTPAIENLETLMGKYGQEGDSLLYKVINFDDAAKNKNTVPPAMGGKGLRYDLTVPFARYVVQHHDNLVFPFKRYQIQPVWRADIPEKGRYREFFQCDVDVIGSPSLLNEVELIRLIDDIFTRLNIKVVIKVNNRNVIAGLVEYIDALDKFDKISIALDKFDKIGFDGVVALLEEVGVDGPKLEKLLPIFKLEGSNAEKIKKLCSLFSSSDKGLKGLNELRTIFDLLDGINLDSKLEFVPFFNRGLDYYTGTMIEVTSVDIDLGSLCGGGRYDNLTAIFGLSGVSGVGVSFGADRIYDVLDQLLLFPKEVQNTTDVLLINHGEKAAAFALKVMEIFKRYEIGSELYPDYNTPLDQQLEYANSKKVIYSLSVDEKEMESGFYKLRDMRTGEQYDLQFSDIIKLIKS